MAIVTLPNGAEYNTGKAWNDQPDTGSFEFIEEVQVAGTPSKITEPGLDPNLPRAVSRTWTETSYTGSNYIFKTTYTYQDSSYAVRSVGDNFTIEDK